MTKGRRYAFLFREAGWIVVGQVGAALGALAFVRVITEQLAAAEYGRMALGLTIAGLVNQLVIGGIVNAIGRYYLIAVESRELGSYLRASQRLMGLATAAVVGAGTLALVVLGITGPVGWAGVAAAALLLALTTGYSGCLIAVQNAARLRAHASLHGAAEAWLRVLFALALVQWLGPASAAVVLGCALASLPVIVSCLLFLRRRHHGMPSADSPGDWLSRMWVFAWPFSAWGAFTWAQQSSDRWALEAFASSEEVGLYAVMYQLGFVPIGLVTGMVTTLLGPIFYQRAGNAEDRSRNASVHAMAWRAALLALAATGVACALAMALHEPLLRLLVAPEYRGRSHLLPWIVLAGGVFAAAQMLALKLLSEMKPSAMAAVKIVTAILGVVLNAAAAAYGGLSGVVFALLATSIVYLCWMAVIARRLEGTT